MLGSLSFKGEPTVHGPRLNAASLDLRPLYYFVQVAELGSFSRASATFSIGQPAISRFIRRLEEDLQITLFHRHGRGVRLTEAGERLLVHGRAILRGLSQAQTEIIALRGAPVGSVSIAMLPMLGDVLAVDLARKFRSDYPLIAIHMREGFAADTLEWLSAGEIDIGVLYNAPNVATLITEHVFDDQLHLVGTPGSLDHIPGSDLPAKRLAELPLILPPAPHRLRAIVQQAAHRAGVELKVEIEVSGLGTLLDLVRARIGYSALPSMLLRGEVRAGRLQSWPIVEPKIMPRLFIATSMQRPQTMATKLMLKVISSLLAKHKGAAGR